MTHRAWKKFLDSMHVAKLARELAKAQKLVAREVATVAKAANKGGKIARKGSKLAKFGKALPIIGIVITVWGWGSDVQAKGLGAGSLNAGLDALPLIGIGKIAAEMITGQDLIPDLEDDAGADPEPAHPDDKDWYEDPSGWRDGGGGDW